MYWNDEGYLLSKINYNENSVIIDVLTLEHGKCSGIVYGGSSRKIKKYLQIGNKLKIIFKSKAENRIGFFTIELIQAISPSFFDEKKKISCILSASSILKILLSDNQANVKIFNSFEAFINDLNKKNWIIFYIFWEQYIIKELGYDFDLLSEKIPNISKDLIGMKIPDIFIKKNNDFTDKEINNGLKFNKRIITEKFLDGNHLKIPKFRNILENYFI